ncbi:MAG: serine/threonine-protein kinase [Pyrinomonadaceae bacterium]
MLALNSVLQNRYQIVRPLGQGGMGAVYEAIDQRVNCLVAVKETFGGQNDYRRAFEREASLLANLRHPTLPKVMDHFTDEHGQFLVMEFIAGNDLGELIKLRARAFDTDDVMRWGDILLGTLEYLHGRNPAVLHRDIKPSNLKLTKEGELFLLDFGLAKGAAGEMPAAMMTSRSVVGYTPIYSPLEQIYGQGTDPRSDLYALGATLYHLITGMPPIDAPARFLASDEERPDPIRPARELNPDVSERVSQVIERAMAMRRKDRPESALALRHELRAAVIADRREFGTSSADDTSFSPDPFDTTPIISSPRSHSRSDSRSGPDSVTEIDPAPSNPRLAPTAPLWTRSSSPSSSAPSAPPEAAPKTMPISLSMSTAPENVPPAATKRNPLLFVGIGAAILIVLVGAVLGVRALLNRPAATTPTQIAAQGPSAPAPAATVERPSGRSLGTLTAQSKVFEVAVGPDGKTVAAVGDESAVHYWRVNGDEKLTDLIGHTKTARSVAISPDGQIVASGSDDNLIRLWRASDGQILQTLTGHTDWVFRLAFSTDGKTLASASGDKTVRLWNVADGLQISSLTTPDSAELIVTLSQDLRMVALYHPQTKRVRLWSIADNQLITELSGRQMEVSGGAFTPDGKTLALGSKDGSVSLWRLDGQSIRNLKGARGTTGSVAFNANGQVLAVGTQDGSIWLWKVSDGTVLKMLKGHSGFVLALAFSADNRVLVSGSEDKTIRLWEMAS